MQAQAGIDLGLLVCLAFMTRKVKAISIGFLTDNFDCLIWCHLFTFQLLQDLLDRIDGLLEAIIAALTQYVPKCCITYTVYPKKYAHGFCFAVLCCGYTLTDFPISIRLTSLALWQSNDCPSASKATLMNMDKYFMWIHYEWLHNHNKA